MSKKPSDVLLVENDAAYAMLILRSFQNNSDDSAVIGVGHSLCSIILDFRLPNLEGHEVIDKIKNSRKIQSNSSRDAHNFIKYKRYLLS